MPTKKKAKPRQPSKLKAREAEITIVRSMFADMRNQRDILLEDLKNERAISEQHRKELIVARREIARLAKLAQDRKDKLEVLDYALHALQVANVTLDLPEETAERNKPIETDYTFRWAQPDR